MAYITINSQALKHNLDTVASRVGTYKNIALVLKDNAYGHGIEIIAQLASSYGVEKAVVQTRDEAKLIDKYFKYILILNDTPKGNLCGFSFSINSIDSIKKFPKQTSVELKVDSGMHRNGISIGELDEAFRLIDKHNLKLKALFTHHRSADELSGEFFWQCKNFEKIKEVAQKLSKKYSFEKLSFHSNNSAATFRQKDQTQMARIGIAAYGVLDMCKSFKTPQLKPVLSLWADRICTKEVKRSQRVGYGGTFVASKDTVASSYDVGYAASLPRSCSNRLITPDGDRLLGLVSMDSSMFDSNKERLLIFNDARVVARSSDTVAYEVLVKLNADIKRVVI